MWAAIWWLQILSFASTHFHSLCTVTHTYSSPLVGPSSSEISQNFIADLNGNGIRAQIAQSVCMADFKVIQQCSSGSGSIWWPQLSATQIGNTGLSGLCWLTTTHTFSSGSGAPSPAAGVSSTESFKSYPAVTWRFIWPRVGYVLDIYSSFIIKKCEEDFFKELRNALIDLMRAGPLTTDCTFGKSALCCNF